MLLHLFMFNTVSFGLEPLGTVAPTLDCRPTNIIVKFCNIWIERERTKGQIMDSPAHSVNICLIIYTQSFITVTIYTIHGTNIPHVSLHYMFSSWWGHLQVHWRFTIACFSFCYSPHTGQCLHIRSALSVWSLYATLLWNVLLIGYLKY
jgi:hypothetical protein